jgi:hypothetical protein
MDSIYNVVAHEFEVTCYLCPSVTRLYLAEFGQYLCLDCIKVLTAVVHCNQDMAENAELN